jgi:hypothetical protein
MDSMAEHFTDMILQVLVFKGLHARKRAFRYFLVHTTL